MSGMDELQIGAGTPAAEAKEAEANAKAAADAAVKAVEAEGKGVVKTAEEALKNLAHKAEAPVMQFVPIVETDLKLAIREAQVEASNLENEMHKLRITFLEKGQELAELRKKLDEKVQAAASKIGVDVEKFILDLRTMIFMPRPKGQGKQ